MATCRRCGVSDSDDAAGEGLPPGWSLETTVHGTDRLCASCTRDHLRDIEAKLDEQWWT